MTTIIDRVHFEERQYLRSYDWTAEQLYHLEMRRRLNLALHLWGIVDGLEVGTGKLDPALPEQSFVKPGMAIDGVGREIILFAPYTFSDDDIVDNRIDAPGSYKLWIAYQRELATPPAPGYRLCDVKDQYTRWRESHKIVISNNPASVASVAVTDDLSDDPDTHPWPVRLGTVDVSLAGGKLSITKASMLERTYIGLRAQRIIAPVSSLPAGTADAKFPIEVQADLLEKKNLTIADAQFDVPKAQVKPPPTAPTFPTDSGNLKVGADIFLTGDLYKFIKGSDPTKDQWLALKEYFRQLMPDIQIGTKEIVPVVPAAPPDPVVGTENIPLTSSLVVNTGTPTMIAAISSIKGVSKANFNTWQGGINANNPTLLEAVVGTVTKVPGPTNTWNFPVNWKIGPLAGGAIPLAIQSFTISYIAVFLP